MQEEINNELWNRNERIVHQVQKGISINGHKVPDPKLHQLISFVKSGIRITGYCLIPFNLWAACLVLVLSEIVGIFEELV